MGAKTTMFVVADGDAKALLSARPALDEAATWARLAEYFPGQKFELVGRGSLDDTYVRSEDQVYIGQLGAVTVIASTEFAHDKPSEIDPRFFRIAGSRNVYTHAMHSAVDFLAFSLRRNGQVVRSFSAAPDGGVMEDVGTRLDFEQPFWAGLHPAGDPEDEQDPDCEPYPLPFHPLELGEAALAAFFGYELEGFVGGSLYDAAELPLLRLRRV